MIMNVAMVSGRDAILGDEKGKFPAFVTGDRP